MTNYPQDIIAAYAERKISRGQFKNRFAEWQKKQGRDYSCKGSADKQGIYLTYRNITATIKNDTLHFKTYADDTFSLLLLFFVLHAFFNLFYIVFAPVIAEDCVGFGTETAGKISFHFAYNFFKLVIACDA